VPADLPTFDELDTPTALRACIVVLHAPAHDSYARTVWSVSLVDITGIPIARESVLEDRPQPLTDLVQPRLQIIDRRVSGEWITLDDTLGRPKHCARIVPWES